MPTFVHAAGRSEATSQSMPCLGNLSDALFGSGWSAGGKGMFDKGSNYEFILIEGTSDGWRELVFEDAVLEIDGPLLKLSSGRIINSHSSLFVSASPITMRPSTLAAETETGDNTGADDV